jgi:hypothetical protein
VKIARDQLDILSAYATLGSYRAAAGLCGTTPKTVRRVVERSSRPAAERPARPRNIDPLTALIVAKVRATDGRISAKRLLPVCQAAGYGGSARNLRRAVAAARAAWRGQRRTYRPWLPVPGEHLVIDWASVADLHVFCVVLAWSRVRFVRFASDETQATTLRLLAECFEILGGPPSPSPTGWAVSRAGSWPTWSCLRPATWRSPATMASGPISASRPIQSRRASSRRSSAMPSATSSARRG